MRGSDDRVQPRYDNYTNGKTPLLVIGFAEGFKKVPWASGVWPVHITHEEHIKDWVASADRPVKVLFLADWAYLKRSERIMAAFQAWRNEHTTIEKEDILGGQP